MSSERTFERDGSAGADVEGQAPHAAGPSAEIDGGSRAQTPSSERSDPDTTAVERLSRSNRGGRGHGL